MYMGFFFLDSMYEWNHTVFVSPSDLFRSILSKWQDFILFSGWVCRLQSMGSLRVGHDWAASLSLFTFMHWRRKWQPTPLFLPGGLPSIGLHRVGHNWGDLAAAAVFHYIHIYHIFFIHSSIDGHLGYFYILAIINDAAINIRVHMSF